MKKQFLLLFAMMMAMCSYGQVWKRATMERAPFKAPLMTNRASAASSEGDGIWWGYMSESDLSVSDGIGTGSSNIPFLTCIYIPANHEMIGGSTIKAVRVYVKEGLGSTMRNVSVWISRSLPASLEAADYVQSVSGLADGANDIELTAPFAVNNQAFYIGYAVTSSNNYPIMCCGTEDAPNSFFICAPGNMDWDDLYGYGFGKLAFQVFAEGATLIDYNASPSNLGSVYGKIGKNTSAEVKIANNGAQSITSIDYTITTDGVAGPEQHADLATPIAFLSKGTAVITIPSETTQSIKDKTLTITKVNGNPNEADDKTAQFTLYSLSKIINRNVVVEEYTGTGCGWCPRGLVGMEKLRNNFGDRFIGIGIHRYNSSDPMYIASYAPIRFSGAPSARINRGEEIDPYYGINGDVCDDFSNEMATPGLGAIEVSGIFDEEQDNVKATAVIEPLFDDTYAVEFSLVADGLTGTTNAWKQSNYYVQYSASQLPDDLSIFGNGGKYGQSSVAGWIFNDVAIASSFESNTNQVNTQTVTGGQKANYVYTLPLPTDATLKEALKMDQIYVVAIMTDSKGMVVNAAKVKVKNKAVEAKVKLSKTKAVIEKGKTLTLKAKVTPETEDQTVTWKSSDKTVATVTSAGKVKAVGVGTAKITCTSKATGAKATCKVTVGYVKLSKTEVVIEKGEIVALKSKVYPTTLKDQSVTWESSDPTIVKVGSTGKIKGMKVGKATITCTSNATGLKATCEVTVGYVKLSDTMVTIEKGKTKTLKAKVYPTSEDQSVTWESSDPTIVKVTSTGKIKGLKVGKAVITCTSNATGQKATCKVTVVKASSAPSLDDVTGIEEKAALAEEFDVYDLNGRRVLDKATSLEGLSNGVYIVNGKKVVIK